MSTSPITTTSEHSKLYIAIGSIAIVTAIGVGLFLLLKPKNSVPSVPITNMAVALSDRGQMAQDQAGRRLIGSDCASLPPADQERCRVQRINAITSGDCSHLSGCERQVCENMFRDGVYPRPMSQANVPLEERIIPPSFSKDYPNGYQPRWTSPLWGTECQTDPIDFYQGILDEIPTGYVNVDVGALPRFDPFLKPGMPTQPYKTQWPIAQNQGFVGLHNFGSMIGSYNFSGQ